MELEKQAILAAEDRKPLREETPEWGGHVWLIGMDSECSDEFSQWLESCPREDPKNPKSPKDVRGITAKLLSLTLCNRTGELMEFTPEEVRLLMRKSSKVTDRLFARAKQLSGLTEELEGNLPAARNGSS